MEERPTLTRRQLLSRAGSGLGVLGLAGLLAEAQEGDPRRSNPLSVRTPHHPPRAKRVIFLYMPGGPSQIDTFDPKPRTLADTGKPLPLTQLGLTRVVPGKLLGSPWKFEKRGQSGIEVSELFPRLAEQVDELCILRSMVADNISHPGAYRQMHTGEETSSRPSLGSWLLYGLGSENQNLPGFVVISPQETQGAMGWSSGFLPAAYQGTYVSDLVHPIANLGGARPAAEQQKSLELLRRLNGRHAQERPDDSGLEARIASFELAFRMQTEAPEAFDVDRESEATKRLYGLNRKEAQTYGRQCLMARRLVERGVRFVEVFTPVNWDHHEKIRTGLPANCASVDVPIAGLLRDLRARGLLDDTLVVWGGEFGRTPTAEGTDGRDHHPHGFTMWMAGGGVKGGQVYGSTDEFGWAAQDPKVHVHDLHATILHLMGIDHEKLTYRYGGRDYRLTDVYGNVVRAILA
ncbi:MAG TPA: DUF1501 domain-containing protein [Planctomycetota bacterium]|nr:DUF1501 domain-containing protein [Planctomycetota bacterium]